MRKTYGIKWREWKQPRERWKEPTELIEKTRLFRTEHTRDRFFGELQEKDQFYDLVDYWSEE